MKQYFTLEKQEWQKEAKDIAEEAFAKYGKNDEAAKEFMYEHIWNCSCLSYTDRAYAIVYDASDSDIDVFYRAGGALDEVGDNEISIKNNETFDDVVLRMAYWIVLTKAIDYYNQLVKEEIIND